MRNLQELEEMRGKDTRELLYDLTTARKDLFHSRLHMESEGGRPSDIASLKKKIARILTVLNQRDEADAADTAASATGAATSGAAASGASNEEGKQS